MPCDHTECARDLGGYYGLFLINLYHYKNRKHAVAKARTVFDFEARDYSQANADAEGWRGKVGTP